VTDPGARPLRTALLLGGSSDIGRAVLEALVPAGLERAVLALRTPDDGLEVPTGIATTQLQWDVLDTGAHDGLVDAAIGVLGHLDVVVCAVGMLGHHAGLGMSAVAVDEMARTNFAGPAAVLSVVADRLVTQGHGTVVVVSSVAAARPRRSNFVYGSSKSGLDAFAQGLGDALVGTGVEVLVVRPGFVRSSMTEGLDPAPFSTVPSAVGAAVARAVDRGRGEIVWVPAMLGPMFVVLRNVPRRLWRRIAGNR
jgi:decaprenylphospho-beta-D-erythro-pentofuranosid-2-ulose 2-reductase